MEASRPFRLLVWGDYALFTRPEMKVERVSYEIMTPSAARGILEAILWKPQMRWIVERIDRLKPVRFQLIRRNEVALKASFVRPEIRADDRDVRLQRAAMVLRDVAYLVHARIALTERAGSEDSLTKYVLMFKRRAESGQCHKQPCLGCREFAAYFRLLGEDETDPEPDRTGNPRPGRIFYDWNFAQRPPRPCFFEAVIEEGRMRVPPLERVEVRR